MNTLMSVAGNPAALKFALNHIGFRVGTPRLPLVEPVQEAAERIVAEVSRNEIDLRVAVT